MCGRALGWRRGYHFLLLGTVASVALADWLFWGHVVGWTAGLFAAALVGLLALRGRHFFRSRSGCVLFLGTAGLVVALVEEPGPLPVAMTALFIAMLSVLNRADAFGDIGAWARRLRELVTSGLFRFFIDNCVAVRWLARRPISAAGPMRSALVWVAPVLLGAGFIGLFAIANPIISRWVQESTSLLASLWTTLAFFWDALRNGFWLLTAMVVYALLRVRRRRLKQPVVADVVPEVEAPPGRLAFTAGVVVRCLLVLNAVFAVQNGLDLVYLFGGAALPDGMTYAAYAHRGAYPLIATALLAAAFVLVTFPPGAAAERSAPARRLVYLWVAQNVFLTFTAAWRLDLYVDAYSLTRMRLAAGLWISLVAAGLVWVVCRIVLRRGNAWLLNANVLTAGALLYACCFVNLDGFIADYNVCHCREIAGGGTPIDLDYLRELGPDALPALRRVAPDLVATGRAHAALTHADALEADLAAQLSGWRGWTLRRLRLRRAGSGPALIALGDDAASRAAR